MTEFPDNIEDKNDNNYSSYSDLNTVYEFSNSSFCLT